MLPGLDMVDEAESRSLAARLAAGFSLHSFGLRPKQIKFEGLVSDIAIWTLESASEQMRHPAITNWSINELSFTSATTS
jgi:hypothetical protein